MGWNLCPDESVTQKPLMAVSDQSVSAFIYYQFLITFYHFHGIRAASCEGCGDNRTCSYLRIISSRNFKENPKKEFMN
jgi:hypothetical protein